MPMTRLVIGRTLLLALAYLATGWLGLKMPSIGAHITLVWVPTGIAVAALLRWGPGVWPGVWLGALAVNLAIGSAGPLAAGIALGNTLGPLVTVAWLRRAGFHAAFDRQKDIGTFIVAASLGMTLSALGGVVCLRLAGLTPADTFGVAWLTWWLGDTVGVLLAAPLLLTLTRENIVQLSRDGRELLAWVVLTGLVVWLAFIRDYAQIGRTLPLAFLTLPMLGWAALRFGNTAAMLAGMGFSVVAAWSTATGHGAFFLPDAQVSLFLLWSYMATTVLAGLLITALQAERLLLEMNLSESQRRMQALLNAGPESTLLLDPQGGILAINRTGAQRFGQVPDELVGRNVFDCLPPELAETRRATLQQAVVTGEPMQSLDRRGALQFENNVVPIKDSAGKIESIAVYAKDVTLELRAQQVDAMFHRLDVVLLKWHLDPDTIGQMFCDEIRPLFDLAAVWIGRAEDDGRLTFLAAAAEGGDAIVVQMRNACRRWDGEPSRCGPAGAALRSGNLQKVVTDDTECAMCRAAVQGAGIQAALFLPLTLRTKAWGVLAIYARERDLFEQPDIPPRLTSIANRLCVSLESSLQQQWLTLLETALSTAGNAVFVTDGTGHIVWANPAFERLSGYAAAEILGQTPKLFSSGAHDVDFYRQFWQTLQDGGTWRGEVINARRDGSHYTVNQTVTPLRDATERISHYVSILEDISERKATEAQIQHMANFDALTDLPNRSMFYDRLGQSLALARRGHHSGALLFLDLDRFKAVNDQLGHDIGDLLLKAVAERLRAQVRETDTVARLGGDEFTVTLPQITDLDDAAHVADKIIGALSRRFELDGHTVNIGVSVGIAVFPEHGDSTEKILIAADTAMYQAKHAGRNTARVYRPPERVTALTSGR